MKSDQIIRAFTSAPFIRSFLRSVSPSVIADDGGRSVHPRGDVFTAADDDGDTDDLPPARDDQKASRATTRRLSGVVARDRQILKHRLHNPIHKKFRSS